MKFRKNNFLKLIDIDLNFKDPFKIKKSIASRYILKCLNLGHNLALKKKTWLELINCAIDKSLIKQKTKELQNI